MDDIVSNDPNETSIIPCGVCGDYVYIDDAFTTVDFGDICEECRGKAVQCWHCQGLIALDFHYTDDLRCLCPECTVIHAQECSQCRREVYHYKKTIIGPLCDHCQERLALKARVLELEEEIAGLRRRQ